MAAQRCSRQFLGSAALGPLLVVGIVLAGPAQADDSSYLNDLHNVGIRDVGGGDSALLVTGWKICSQLGYGATPGQLIQLALQTSDADLGAKGLNPVQANDLIAYAQQDLCPRA
ncbi:hypothetical protein MSAS_39220 [Mycobacterium saskatchewanense]|uniref:DUF732 domain-containing protein n=1 Tax=Mycobacterium saskatchewanense TaxID=220927 RepID=A0A1X2C787_9MYCO|nr:DUF732 domain-containing protein [Mycobacterium saskatchewanense]ORW71179.1 hypothetical protein AWC23_14920 [Mycobacterium saskatchewanense]BBX64748.1 hypothetical protein MSAS_39220 [Mycobacterium saskatchewanense]